MSKKEKSVYVFVDNSNIWIEGKRVSGQNKRSPVPSDWRYRLDYGKLLDLILGVRTLGDVPKLYGSEPPPIDTVWKKIRNCGFDVTLFKRNIFNKEKGLDMKMGMDMIMLAMRVKPPGVIAVVAGDADYEPIINQAKIIGWDVEVYYWANAAQNVQKAATRFVSLNAHLYNIGFDSQS